MKRFVAGVVIGVLLGAGAAVAIRDATPERASAAQPAAAGSECDDVARTIREALSRDGEPGVEVGSDDAVLCATDVDVLEP